MSDRELRELERAFREQGTVAARDASRSDPLELADREALGQLLPGVPTVEAVSGRGEGVWETFAAIREAALEHALRGLVAEGD